MTPDFPYRPVLEKTVQHALEYLDALDTTSVDATATKEELRKRLYRPLSDSGVDSVQIIDELVKDTQGGLLGSAGSRFYAWVIGGSVPAALAADWLTSTWDQNSGLYACSPAEAIIEEVCGEWLKELLGIPKTASFALVTGCQMSHFTCLGAARHHLLAAHGWNVENKGLFGAPPIRIITGERHGTLDRAIRMLGLGLDSITPLPVNQSGQLEPETLAGALEKYKAQPCIVALQAGDINTGSFDDFTKLIPVAHTYKAWVHIDGAFGLWVRPSSIHGHLMNGAELADSWSTDGHKWLNVPYDSGYAFVAHPDSHRASLSHRASYLTHDDQARDQMEWNPEWSRRGRGIATYAAIRQLGRAGIAEMIDRNCRCAKEIVLGIGALPGAQIMHVPTINQGMVRFLDSSPNATDEQHSQRTDKVVEAINRLGDAFFTGTTWQGKRCMRISVCNWQTDDADVARTVESAKRALTLA
jgi:glutamate/tyrosine decarboxylase-like PLP-dependent enzyme